jgi:hypothetical protein
MQEQQSLYQDTSRYADTALCRTMKVVVMEKLAADSTRDTWLRQHGSSIRMAACFF